MGWNNDKNILVVKTDKLASWILCRNAEKIKEIENRLVLCYDKFVTGVSIC